MSTMPPSGVAGSRRVVRRCRPARPGRCSAAVPQRDGGPQPQAHRRSGRSRRARRRRRPCRPRRRGSSRACRWRARGPRRRPCRSRRRRAARRPRRRRPPACATREPCPRGPTPPSPGALPELSCSRPCRRSTLEGRGAAAAGASGRGCERVAILTISQDYPRLQAGLHPQPRRRARLPSARRGQRVACPRGTVTSAGSIDIVLDHLALAPPRGAPARMALRAPASTCCRPSRSPARGGRADARAGAPGAAARRPTTTR